MENLQRGNELQSAWEGIAKEMFPEPKTESMTIQVVKLQPSVLVADMAILENLEMQRVMRFTKSDVILDVKDIEKYFNTILWLRVLQVNHDKRIAPYAFANHSLNIPVRLVQILLSMGEAVDRDYGIRFMPSMDIEAEKQLSPEELREFSDKISVMIPEGYLVVETGLPTSTLGELGFMACLLVQDEKIYSYRKDHPVYGFIASFFRSELVSKAFGIDYRMYYGSIEDYRAMLSRIYRK